MLGAGYIEMQGMRPLPSGAYNLVEEVGAETDCSHHALWSLRGGCMARVPEESQEVALGLQGPAVHWVAQGLYFTQQSPWDWFSRGNE